MTPAEARAAMLAEGTLELWNGRPVLTPQGQRQLDAFLPTVPTLQKMFAVLVKHPNLTSAGFNDSRSAESTAASVQLAKDVDGFEWALAWLRTVPLIATPRAYSWRLAQEAAYWAGAPISPGALLCAALHLRIPMKRLVGARHAFVGVGKRR
jgi:hypothetical protein